jgi:hypothetical protein
MKGALYMQNVQLWNDVAISAYIHNRVGDILFKEILKKRQA